MRRRQLLITAGAASVALAGYPSETARVRGQVSDEGSEYPYGPEPQEFEGSGAEVVEGVDIEGGVTVVEAAHDGERNFIVTLVPADGEFDALFVNHIGEYEGETADVVDEGEYLLDVDADGAWEITIRQPRLPADVEEELGDDVDVEEATEEYVDALPLDFEGSGNTVVGPIEFEGAHVATGAHGGERNFIATIVPAHDHFGELVFNEIGEWEGETAFRFDGVGWLAVEADGEWTIAME